jgi:hypothetical protein
LGDLHHLTQGHSGEHTAEKYVRRRDPRTSLQRRRSHHGFPSAHNNRICRGDGRSSFPHCNCRRRRAAIIVAHQGLAQDELDCPLPVSRDRDEANVDRTVSNGWIERRSGSQAENNPQSKSAIIRRTNKAPAIPLRQCTAWDDWGPRPPPPVRPFPLLGRTLHHNCTNNLAPEEVTVLDTLVDGDPDGAKRVDERSSLLAYWPRSAREQIKTIRRIISPTPCSRDN